MNFVKVFGVVCATVFLASCSSVNEPSSEPAPSVTEPSDNSSIVVPTKDEILESLWGVTVEQAKLNNIPEDQINEAEEEFNDMFGCILDESYDKLSDDTLVKMGAGDLETLNSIDNADDSSILSEAQNTCGIE